MTAHARIVLLCLLGACGGAAKEAPSPAPAAAPVVATGAGQSEETDDGLELQGTRGTLDAAAVAPVFQANAGKVDACYSGNVDKNTRFVGGRLVLGIKVGPDGAARDAWPAAGDLGSRAIERCLADLARALTYPKPRGGDADVEFPLEFQGGGEPVAEGDPGDLAARLPKLSACAKAGTPAKAYSLIVYVGPGGKVKSAGVVGDHVDPLWADCVHGRAMTWKLPDPRGRIVKIQVGATDA